MTPFIRVTGGAVALPAANVDTDVIMPKQFLKGIDRTGLDHGLFHDLRFDPAGAERADFALNLPAAAGARFLIVGPNFGCGSSREHAVWGLAQYGIRALISTSFAGIFFDNCGRNGLAALSLGAAAHARLMQAAEAHPGLELTVDLEACRITHGGGDVRFEIEAGLRAQLLGGQDTVDVTLRWRDEILAFQDRHFAAQPWLR
ncbi:3-isopropylmalate dehydratase small subunit [Phaeovulum sp. W22_SRMD_FR3]|uniref:3-isopropylmalate dehydratase small subunit n=1 Tax=Phaeovulum sp. W22_SRMD_FR3 TaxID=3240274 RepID=UPI003F9815C3